MDERQDPPPPARSSLLDRLRGGYAIASVGVAHAVRAGRWGGHHARSFHNYLAWRRINEKLIGGEKVVEFDTGDGPELLFKRKAGLWLALRELGPAVVFLTLCAGWPVWLLAPVAIAVHMRTIDHRQQPHRTAAIVIGVLEAAFCILILATHGSGALRGWMIVWTLAMAAVTYVAWAVDVQFISTTQHLHRETGLLWMDDSESLPLSKLDNFKAKKFFVGPWGSIAFDTAAEDDQLFHVQWGVVSEAKTWVGKVRGYTAYVTGRRE